jgi:serine protease AprX
LILATLTPRPASADGPTSTPGPGNHPNEKNLDAYLAALAKSGNPFLSTPIVVTLNPGAQLPPQFSRFVQRELPIINGYVMSLPNGLLKQVASHPDIFAVHFDRPIGEHNYLTSLTVGGLAVQRTLGLTGAGIGVAVIDSGITTWHDDLTNRSTTLYPYGNQRVAAFVDYVNGRPTPYDDDGHGTHVAGTIAGNGYDSNGQKAGIAPDASLVSLKVLDANGHGTISNIIAAFGWIVAHKSAYNIRVVNLSVGANITESYRTDPLTLAAKAAADAGVVVVVAAGNAGKNALGQPQWGGIQAPGNAPWVITVGASSTNGTASRGDDTIASFSSRGPTYIDWAAKPDLVAPGTGTVSLADPTSTFYLTKPNALVAGLVSTPNRPYISLSGTSMAAPVVTGTVALMLQANPSLTPNAVKAILEYTAQTYQGYNGLVQGAGFLNTVGAVRLARFFATAQPGVVVPTDPMWAQHILWGTHMISGGIVVPGSNAFATSVIWGAARTASGSNIVWGNGCGGNCDNIVWGNNVVWGNSTVGDNIVWGNANYDDNIVWGNDCGGADCAVVWGTVDIADNIVWGNVAAGDNIVWGNSVGGDNVVWGNSADSDNVVWGNSDGSDNVVWGNSDGSDNVVWGNDLGDNIVWGNGSGAGSVWSVVPVAGGPATTVNGPQVFDQLHDGQLLKLIDKQAKGGGL